MKIAYVLGSFPVLSETFIGNEIRGMQDVGCDVEIIAFDRPDKPAQPEDETLAEQACYMPQLAKPSWRMPSLAALTFCYKQTQLPTLSLYYNALKLAYHIKQRGCTHIHTHFAWGNSAHAIVAAKLLGLPVTMTCHGSDVVATPQDIALKVKSVDAVITVSEPLADRLKAFASTPVHIVPCGVNTDVFSPSKSKEHRHAGEGQYLEQQDSGLRQKDGLCDNGKLLFIGRLMDCKGVDDLLHALAIAPNPPVLDIVGDGALRPELEALRDRLNLQEQVTFLGAQSQAWMHENMPQYHAFIAPFREGNDGMRDASPTVLKEAMACGLPIITTDFLAIPDIVGQGSALLVSPADRHELADAIFQIQDMDAENRSIMGRNGRKRVIQKFSIIHQCQRLKDIWEGLA